MEVAYLRNRTVETWRDEYMTFNEIERRGYLQGEKDGKAEGKREGKQEDIN